MKHILTLLLMTAGLPALAKDIPPAISDLISQLDLEAARWHPGDDRADLEGRLHGTWVEIDLHRNGTLEEIQAEHDGLIPASAIAVLVPTALRSSPDYPADAFFEKIEFDRDAFEIRGRTAGGRWFEAKFDGSGHLTKWDIK
ncbi:hypothetical protein LA6_005800 (plasmid) [Marinibacterium anthonyi]|nr:hypothetical protein LA6_005800 [Marinibacterium anthonyi]